MDVLLVLKVSQGFILWRIQTQALVTVRPPHITGGLWTIYVVHLPQHAMPLRVRNYSVTHVGPKAKGAVLSSWESLQIDDTGYRSRNLPSLCLVQCFKSKGFKQSCLIRIKPILTLYQVTSTSEQPSRTYSADPHDAIRKRSQRRRIYINRFCFVGVYTEWMYNPQQVTWPFSPTELHILWLATILAL